MRTSKRLETLQPLSTFLMKAAKNDVGWNRVAVVVPARVVRTAARRHRLKRVILQEIGEWRNISADILIIVRPKAGVANRESLRKELERAQGLITQTLYGRAIY